MIRREAAVVGRQLLDKHGDERPVYGLFVAERLTPTIITDFFARHRIPTTEFAGPVSIIPLSVEDFRAMLVAAKERRVWSTNDLHRFFRRTVKLAGLAPNETVWHAQVRHLAANWLDTAMATDPAVPSDLLARYDEQRRILSELEDQLWGIEVR